MTMSFLPVVTFVRWWIKDIGGDVRVIYTSAIAARPKLKCGDEMVKSELREAVRCGDGWRIVQYKTRPELAFLDGDKI
jgi:hypothetical protein